MRVWPHPLGQETIIGQYMKTDSQGHPRMAVETLQLLITRFCRPNRIDFKAVDSPATADSRSSLCQQMKAGQSHSFTFDMARWKGFTEPLRYSSVTSISFGHQTLSLIQLPYKADCDNRRHHETDSAAFTPEYLIAHGEMFCMYAVDTVLFTLVFLALCTK